MRGKGHQLFRPPLEAERALAVQRMDVQPACKHQPCLADARIAVWRGRLAECQAQLDVERYARLDERDRWLGISIALATTTAFLAFYVWWRP